MVETKKTYLKYVKRGQHLIYQNLPPGFLRDFRVVLPVFVERIAELVLALDSASKFFVNVVIRHIQQANQQGDKPFLIVEVKISVKPVIEYLEI